MKENVFSKQLQQLRRKHGMTQEQLARQLGVSPQAVSKWENGSYPEGDLIPTLADLFGVSVSYLYGREEERPSLQQAVLDDIRGLMLPREDRPSDPNSHPEVADRMQELIWAMMIAPWMNNRAYYPPVQGDESVRTAAAMMDNASFSFMGLDTDNRFFVHSRCTQDPVPSDPAVAQLLSLLGEEGTLPVLRFMLTLAPKEFVSPAVAGKAAGVTEERAEEVFRRLRLRPKWNSLIQTVSSVNAQGKKEVLYGIEHISAGLLVSLFQIARVLIDPPDGYQMQIGVRSRGYAVGEEKERAYGNDL